MSGVEVKHEKMHTTVIALGKDSIILSYFKTTELHGHRDQLILYTLWKHWTTNLIQACILLALTYCMCFLLFLTRCWRYDWIHCYFFFPSKTDSFFIFSLCPCFCQACIQEEALRDPVGSTVSPSGATPWSLSALNNPFVSISLLSFFVFITTHNIFSCRILLVLSVFTCLSAITVGFCMNVK